MKGLALLSEDTLQQWCHANFMLLANVLFKILRSHMKGVELNGPDR